MPTSARKMGKNDVWIAATAAVLDIPLLSTDADFQHLHNVYLDLHNL
jgi:tRNA(fMet)-specific endonuclease VapC